MNKGTAAETVKTENGDEVFVNVLVIKAAATYYNVVRTDGEVLLRRQVITQHAMECSERMFDILNAQGVLPHERFVILPQVETNTWNIVDTDDDTTYGNMVPVN